MRTKTSILVAALCFTLVLSASVLPQAAGGSARNTTMTRALNSTSVAYAIPGLALEPYAKSNPSNATGAATLESVVPRDGLQFYFEIRGGGLAQLAQAGAALGPLVKMLAGPVKASAPDFAGFAISQMGTLSNARLALVSYGGNSAAALIEAANPNDAEVLRASLARLLGAGEMGVGLRGQLVVAGAKPIVARLVESEEASAIAEDQSFMKARQRFADDPFFAYVELGGMLPIIPTPGDVAHDPSGIVGMLAGLTNSPYAVAIGGTLQGETARVRVLALFSSKKGEGLFSGLFSSVSSASGGPVAASFASPDTDLFLDMMLDWNKLYDSLQTMFAKIAGAMSEANPQSNNAMQSVDIFAMLEMQLGFSIRHDLIPTLGNEVAISFADFSKLMRPAAASTAGRPSLPVAKGLPRILVIAELRDAAKFEKLFSRILNPSGRQAAQLSQESYRGATIKYGPSVAFAFSKNYFFFAPTAAEIRRALDTRATGSSLASTAEFRSAVGEAGQAAMQAYVSPKVAGEMLKSVIAEAAKSNPELKSFIPAIARTRSAIGMTMKSDADGLLIEARVPANLAFMALATMATSQPSPYGITTSGQRRPGGRRTPKLTTDDVRATRKP